MSRELQSTCCRHRLWTLLGSALAVLLIQGVPRADAATVAFTVVNPSGIAQGSTAVGGVPGSLKADAYGHVSVSGLGAGQTIYFSRDGNSTCPPPEGAGGQAYTVPNPVPSNATITLPNSNGAPYETGVSSSERGLVGLINQQRAQSGAGLLEISTVASDAADRYSNYRVLSGAEGHCVIGSPRSRLIDAGYPVSATAGTAENIWYCSTGSAYCAFNGWMASPGHRANMLNPAYRVVGVGRVNTDWTLDLLPACTSACERAGLTGDYGDPSLADGDPSDGRTTNDSGGGPGSQCLGLTGKKFKSCQAKARAKCKHKRKAKARKRCARRVNQNLGLAR